MLQIVLELFFLDLGGHVTLTSICFYMFSLAQPCAATGETIVVALKYCITNVLYILI